MRRPRCYGCGERPIRQASFFCTQRCAADYAEEIALGNDIAWCPSCNDWVDLHDGRCSDCGKEVCKP